MANDYSRQAQSTADKASEFTKAAEDKGKEIADNAQQMLKEGQEQAGKFVKTLDKQVRENPWPYIAGVAIGAFLIGSLHGKSKN